MKAFIHQKLMLRTYCCLRELGRSYSQSIVGIVNCKTYTVKLVYNDTLGATKLCCYNQVVVVTRAFSTETIESVSAMCVAVKRLLL